MKLSCCVWALNYGRRSPLRFWRRLRKRHRPETEILKDIARLGFTTIDIRPSFQKSEEAKLTLNELGLDVSCVALSHGAPKVSNFDSMEVNRINPIIQHTNAGLDHASTIGASFIYVVPGNEVDDQTRSNYADQLVSLAERGQNSGVKVCIEHFPNTLLPTVSATIDFIKEVDHPNLYLLFDIGHAQINKEDPAKVIPMAGDRLGYVHLDDNDGFRDLHLALTDGVQTQESLADFLGVLADIHYDGPMSLEIHAGLPNPLDAIRRSKKIVEDLIDTLG
jgi:sugar phosphate isomerase/epimerase